MELLFSFKNIATNKLLDFTNKRENINDFILTKLDKYPYSENYFVRGVINFKHSLPNFENEILQIINTTDQATIDIYFNELNENIKLLRDNISLENITFSVKKWNEETLKDFEEQIEKETEEYFKSNNRKRKHLEVYEDIVSGRMIELNIWTEAKKVKRINNNFYCVERVLELIDENYIDLYFEFIGGLFNEYMEIFNRYSIPYSKGEIISKFEKTKFYRPVVFVEGFHDVEYIKKAAELLKKKEILNQVELRSRGGCDNLDKIWDVYKDNDWETIPQKKLLLYDCDVKKQNGQIGNVYRRTIETIPQNMIGKGIENLFPRSIISRAMKEKKAFVDIKRVNNLIRGEQKREITYTINKNEKTELCKWICENGTAKDFVNFSSVFDLIRSVLSIE